MKTKNNKGTGRC